MADKAVRFTVHGVAQPAGSKRAFVRGGRAMVVDDAKGSAPWKRTVGQVAGGVMSGRRLLDGPIALRLIFVVPRPKGHFGTGRNAGQLRASAPDYPTVKPDVLKLARAVEDALTGVVYRDDAQIVDEALLKRYGEPARVEVLVTEIQAQQEVDAA